MVCLERNGASSKIVFLAMLSFSARSSKMFCSVFSSDVCFFPCIAFLHAAASACQVRAFSLCLELRSRRNTIDWRSHLEVLILLHLNQDLANVCISKNQPAHSCSMGAWIIIGLVMPTLSSSLFLSPRTHVGYTKADLRP